ncbi:unnamed protein product [Fraxinus pennsylvanica]|uniref:mitogen-activated protein kinase kinase kinase n=1 Tax=Fraxinus pennsylvanica TaxID=56036 RepID=A0AAD2DKH5_9LAMI|nr:unnamed protein product [Fraxinus pennsylvanica]
MRLWSQKSSKEVKNKKKGESFLNTLHRKCIRPGATRRCKSDTISDKASQSREHSQSLSSSTRESCCQSFAEKPQAQTLPLPVGRLPPLEPALSSNDSPASDGSSDSEDSSNIHLLSPQASDCGNRFKSDTASPSKLKQKDQYPINTSRVQHLQTPSHSAFARDVDSSVTIPSRSPNKVYRNEPVMTNGLHPGCSPLPSPRMTLPGPSSKIHNDAITPPYPRTGEPFTELPMVLDDGKQQFHRLPLPPETISNLSPSLLSHSPGISPRIPRSPSRTEITPNLVSRWKKGRLLGRGTYGQVYLGFDCESGEMCAMKEVILLSDDAKSRESAKQLGQEIALLSRLRHPNIVQYYGSEIVDDKLYIYLEYVSGGSIYKILQEYGHLGEAAIRSYAKQILSGLVYLHAKNTVHRDIKGANILVEPNGRVKLADFGMAKHITGPSCPLSFKGSPHWMAPEVIKNSKGCNLAVDIWSLGCTVLEMATTKPPWSQYEGVAAMFKVGNSKELPHIPDYLSNEGNHFVRQCLQRDPTHRPTAAQLLEHPFIRNTPSWGRSSLRSESMKSIPAVPHTIKSLGFGPPRNPPCLGSSEGAVYQTRSPDHFPGFRTDAYVPSNISCPNSPIRSHLLHSRSQQHTHERMSPSSIQRPKAASSSSTPRSGGNDTFPFLHSEQPTHYLHEPMRVIVGLQKPNIFQGLVQAHLSPEGASSENGFLGVERSGGIGDQKEQSYDANFLLADRVSRQLLMNPLRLNPIKDLNPNSPVPGHNNGV